MVSVTHKFTPSSDLDGLKVQTWLDSLSTSFPPDEVEVIRRACKLAEQQYGDQIEPTNIPLLQHALGTAAILASMNMDYETVVAAILHAIPEHMQNWTELLEKEFGKNITGLMLGMSRMEQIQDFSDTHGIHKDEKNKGDQAQQTESLRKMLLAMVEDIRPCIFFQHINRREGRFVFKRINSFFWQAANHAFKVCNFHALIMVA